MTDIEELFDEMGSRPAPPSQLTAARVYRAGRRRRWGRRLAVNGAVAAAVVGVTVAASAMLRPVAPPPDTGTALVLSGEEGAIWWMRAVDQDHLYALIGDCVARSCTRLVGSDDGGRTWSERRDILRGRNGVYLLDARALVVWAYDGTPQVSTDGAVTWSAAPVAGDEVPTVPAAGTAICLRADSSADNCVLHAVDPVARRTFPLAGPPGLDIRDVRTLPDGPLLVTGHAAGTTQAAVAVSGDRGRTWRTRVFDCLCDQVTVARAGVGVIDVAVGGAQGLTRFRSVDQGTAWQRVDLPSPPTGLDPIAGVQLLVRADGTELMETLGRDAQRFYEADHAGDTWRPVAVDGLPADARLLSPDTGGGLLAHRQAEDGCFYRSADGRNWTNHVIALS